MFQHIDQAAHVATRPQTRHDFDKLNKPQHCRIAMRRATRDDYLEANRHATKSIGTGLADRDAVWSVMDKNANSVLIFETRGNIAGFWAMLPLSSSGLEALFTNELDTQQPHTEHIAALNTAPAAIYIWLVVAPGLIAEGIRHVSTFLRQPLFARANLYARSATGAGNSIILRTGFLPVERGPSGLYRYLRRANSSASRNFAS